MHRKVREALMPVMPGSDAQLEANLLRRRVRSAMNQGGSGGRRKERERECGTLVRVLECLRTPTSDEGCRQRRWLEEVLYESIENAAESS